MSRVDRANRGASSHDVRHSLAETTGIAAFLRALAAQAERDPAFARQLGDALYESGLVPAEPSAPVLDHRSGKGRPSGKEGQTQTDQPPDPFVVLRAGGEPAVHAALEGLDLATLR